MESNESKISVNSGIKLGEKMNMKIVQNILLIWLDGSIDENRPDCLNTMTQFRSVVNNINTFTDGDHCIQFLETIKEEKVYMVISGSLGQHFVPRVHDMSQVESIFIFCHNKKYHEGWTKQWSKIRGIFTEVSLICEALKESAQHCKQNAISMSFVATSEDLSKKNLDQLDATFMYTQIFKEILLTIKFEEKHFKEFIEYCREIFADNENELKNVDKLQRKYHIKTPIWWYTFECFLYPMLNRALRLMDVDIMIKMGFLISDLHRHIDQLHEEQFGSQSSKKIFTVYRGQGVPKKEFEQMNKIIGGLMSFNSFLSTSKSREVSFDFAKYAAKNSELVGVLFTMTIDPSQSVTPFASVANVSFYKDTEDEILFSMHTVFRICDIQPIDRNRRLFQVDLTLTNDNDKDLFQLINRIREETEKFTGWDQLGMFLIKIGEVRKAEQVYHILLEQATDEIEKAHSYCQIGWAKNCLGEYKHAIMFSQKALKIRQKLLPQNHLDLAISYSDIGSAYDNIGEYSKALSYYEKALEIRQTSLPPNHPDLAKSYIAHGLVYNEMGESSKAIEFYEKALEIQLQSLPSNHPDIAISYNNIGVAYEKMHEYSKALSYYEKHLEISQKTLPPNHPGLATSYNNIGVVYKNMGEYSKSLLSHEKALAIRQQSLPPNHPDLAMSYGNIGNVYVQLKNYSKALSYHGKTHQIFEKTLPSNHPNLAMSYNNIGLIYEKMGNFSKAHAFFQGAVDIGEESLSSNHPELQKCRLHLDRIKKQL